MSAASDSDDVLEGLPPDLVRVLRDPSIIVPQDQAVFELVAKWMDAPGDTASAMSVDEWRQAWSVTCRRMLDAQAERDRARHLAKRLFQMIDRETWRATGGDDGQGHYEGDYRAVQIEEEIRSWE